MSTRWKRNTVVATMAVLVCAAVALNWRYSGETAVQGGQDSDTKFWERQPWSPDRTANRKAARKTAVCRMKQGSTPDQITLPPHG